MILFFYLCSLLLLLLLYLFATHINLIDLINVIVISIHCTHSLRLVLFLFASSCTSELFTASVTILYFICCLKYHPLAKLNTMMTVFHHCNLLTYAHSTRSLHSRYEIICCAINLNGVLLHKF